MLVSASTNPPPLSELQPYLKELSTLPVDYVHCDIMDGKFVPNATFDFSLLPTIFEQSYKSLDVHVMAENIDKTYKNYITCGVKILTIHYEAVQDKSTLKSVILHIKSQGIMAGLAIKPKTTFDEVSDFLEDIDLLLIMSVEPGKSYQKFIETTPQKVQQFAQFRTENNLSFLIEIDGGVNADNVSILKDCGADMVVVGGFLYSSEDRNNAILSLKG